MQLSKVSGRWGGIGRCYTCMTRVGDVVILGATLKPSFPDAVKLSSSSSSSNALQVDKELVGIVLVAGSSPGCEDRSPAEHVNET